MLIQHNNVPVPFIRPYSLKRQVDAFSRALKQLQETAVLNQQNTRDPIETIIALRRGKDGGHITLGKGTPDTAGIDQALVVVVAIHARDLGRSAAENRPAHKLSLYLQPDRLAQTGPNVVGLPMKTNGPDKIVAVGLLTRRDLDVLGTGFQRLFPIDEAHPFTDLLQALDAVEEQRTPAAKP